ncbi:hypothetical protein [Vibrio sp.]|uniref:hypothetical protein n=1 Tax=Vibrio sp. TaxID=678 RepID=UPI00311FCF03
MKIINLSLLLAAFSFSAQASFAPTNVYLDGKAYPVVELESEVVTKSSVEIDLNKEERQKMDSKGFAELSKSFNFLCRLTLSNTFYFTELKPGDSTMLYSFDQTCAYKRASGALTNLSNAWLSLQLVDGSGSVVGGPSRSVYANPGKGKYYWVVINRSTGSRGDGYIKTTEIH